MLIKIAYNMQWYLLLVHVQLHNKKFKKKILVLCSGQGATSIVLHIVLSK